MKDKLIKIGAVLAVIIGIYLYFKQRAYIGYFIAVLAIPYGAYGLFKPYKSAVEYAKKGYALTYSRQLGLLITSLGVLGIFFSRLYGHFSETPLFLLALLIYMMLFFITLYILNKRYIKKL
ncbi:MAG: hypothetical protein ACLUKQ_11505 [Peptococcaceae bacterium]